MTDTNISETIARLRELGAKATPGPWHVEGDGPVHIVTLDDASWLIDGHVADTSPDDGRLIAAMRTHLTALLDAAEAGMRARRTALEDAKAALKDLWFGDEVARPGSLDAIEAIDALLAASPTCNEGLQVQAEAGTVKLDLTIDAASDVGFTLSTPNVDVIRDAALEEAAKALDELVFELVAVSATNDNTDGLRLGAHRIRALKRRPA